MWNWESHLGMIDKWFLQDASAQLKGEFIWTCFWKRRSISWRAPLLNDKCAVLLFQRSWLTGHGKAYRGMSLRNPREAGVEGGREAWGEKKVHKQSSSHAFFSLTGNLFPPAHCAVSECWGWEQAVLKCADSHCTSLPGAGGDEVHFSLS